MGEVLRLAPGVWLQSAFLTPLERCPPIDKIVFRRRHVRLTHLLQTHW